jgi:peroxiredoxin
VRDESILATRCGGEGIAGEAPVFYWPRSSMRWGGIVESKSWGSFVVDVLAGVMVGVALAVVAVLFPQHGALVIAFAIVVGVRVTMLRAGQRPSVAWVRGLLVGVGAAGPITALALYKAGSKGDPGAWVFLISSILLCGVVAEATALYRNGRNVIALLEIAGCVVAIALLWTAGLRLIMPKPKMVKMDKPLPELALQRMDGTPIALSEVQGRVTVMDFWGTWCPGCVEEMPVLKEVAAGYSDDSRVQFLLVNPEMDGDEPGKIRAFVQKKGIAIPVALDPSQSCFKLGAMLFPTTLVIDRRGHIRYERSGFDSANSTRKELRGEVDELLKE